ncbi:MAG: peptidylprolyl isomerase [Cyanothece sp. SIO1E1]|nr:peptidylprolyl isomerase [Cyanothece sp. SIO1E1]
MKKTNLTRVLQVGNQTIPAAEVITLLAKYRLLPQLLREILIDQSIASIDCTADEEAKAHQLFCERNQLLDESQRQAWLEQRGMTLQQLQELVAREVKTEKFKQLTWGSKLESYFLQRKRQFDRVIYSLLRTQDAGIAQELYFRIQEGEQSFAELAREYSKGPEAQTGGLIGPVELSTPHPILAQLLAVSQLGQLWPPKKLGDWFVIVRLEKFLPAQLDEPMRQKLLNELFNTWMQEQLQQHTLKDSE